MRPDEVPHHTEVQTREGSAEIVDVAGLGTSLRGAGYSSYRGRSRYVMYIGRSQQRSGTPSHSTEGKRAVIDRQRAHKFGKD